MKAITIWQPWASLIAVGAKKFETRSWATSYRGPIAIHAAAKPIEKVYKELFPLSAWNYHPDSRAKIQLTEAVEPYLDTGILEYGAVVAVAELAGCWEIKRQVLSNTNALGATAAYTKRENGTFYEFPSDDERLFGNWTPGRYAWELENVQMLPVPIPARGK